LDSDDDVDDVVLMNFPKQAGQQLGMHGHAESRLVNKVAY
jgi:hypothetical protein